ncbi:hypothetical protein AC1031_018720 [Aphanomyces cochlioides]|nr:hypothetical protein AC1031_018720 [Aphanomyces cochlioides]
MDFPSQAQPLRWLQWEDSRDDAFPSSRGSDISAGDDDMSLSSDESLTIPPTTNAPSQQPPRSTRTRRPRATRPPRTRPSTTPVESTLGLSSTQVPNPDNTAPATGVPSTSSIPAESLSTNKPSPSPTQDKSTTTTWVPPVTTSLPTTSSPVTQTPAESSTSVAPTTSPVITLPSSSWPPPTPLPTSKPVDIPTTIEPTRPLTTSALFTTATPPPRTTNSPPATDVMPTPIPRSIPPVTSSTQQSEAYIQPLSRPSAVPTITNGAHSASNGHSNSFPVSAIIAIVVGVLALLFTVVVVSYYRRRYRLMSLTYLRNMPSTAWTLDSAAADSAIPPRDPSRSPSMSIWTNPNRMASEFATGFKDHWKPTPLADYHARRSRLPELQSEVDDEALQNNAWYQAAKDQPHPKSFESLGRLDPATRQHMNQLGHNLVYDPQALSYTSADGANDECASVISFKSSGQATPHLAPRGANMSNKLSMTSWDDFHEA